MLSYLLEYQDATLLLMFFFIVAMNLVVALLLGQWVAKPQAQKKSVEAQPAAMPQGQIGFRIYPLEYPKVHDNELNAYVPELIHVEIENDAQSVFSANFARDALKQLRNTIDAVLQVREKRK
jgi:hypothetical protein